jgi:hypothetical protein
VVEELTEGYGGIVKPFVMNGGEATVATFDFRDGEDLLSLAHCVFNERTDLLWCDAELSLKCSSVSNGNLDGFEHALMWREAIVNSIRLSKGLTGWQRSGLQYLASY